MGTSLAEDSLTSGVFARFVGGSTGAQTGVSLNRLAAIPGGRRGAVPGAPTGVPKGDDFRV